jgi:hypothetical protein
MSHHLGAPLPCMLGQVLLEVLLGDLGPQGLASQGWASTEGLTQLWQELHLGLCLISQLVAALCQLSSPRQAARLLELEQGLPRPAAGCHLVEQRCHLELGKQLVSAACKMPTDSAEERMPMPATVSSRMGTSESLAFFAACGQLFVDDPVSYSLWCTTPMAGTSTASICQLSNQILDLYCSLHQAPNL